MRKDRNRLIQFMRAISKIDSLYYRVQRDLGLKESLFVLLYMCADGEGRSQKELCDEWFIPRTTLNTTVKEQEAAGHVELIPCGNKQKLVRLTESGRAYAEELLGPLLAAEDRVAQRHLNDKLIKDLEDFANRMEDELGNVRHGTKD